MGLIRYNHPFIPCDMPANWPFSIFELLKGELVEIVDYALDSQKKTGRPLTLAVNASSWWYYNMTAATAQAVRDSGYFYSVEDLMLTKVLPSGVGAHVNPIERNILFYTLRILHLGIQLHFVFDGPKRLSNGGKTYPGHDAPSLLFQDTLTHMGIPWHKAPAAAEAECAKMEMEGLVDGVWSEDGDALAFGCQTLIMSHSEIISSTEKREDIRKSFAYFRVYRSGELRRQHPGMGREGFILCAILNSGSRDVKEIYNIRTKDVLNAARRGLGRSLCETCGSVESLRQWATADFAAYLKANGRSIELPPGFPKWEHIQDYLNPLVSTRETLLGLPEPRDPFLNEKKLFSFLLEKFQWTIKQWVTYVIPVRIVRSLLMTKEGEESQHDHLKLECDLKKDRKKVKVSFLLCKATSLDVSSLYEKRGQFETLLWILRKANFNEQRSIASYFTTPPKSAHKGKGSSSASSSGNSFQESSRIAGRNPLTPPSGASPSSNGESSSTRIIERSMRQNTPLSPTPTSKKRSLPWAQGTGISKRLRPAPKTDNRPSSQTKDKGKGKAKEIPASSRADQRRAQSPADSVSFYEELQDNGPEPTVDCLPSTPPAQVTRPEETAPDVILVDSEENEHGEAFNNLVVVDSDSDEDQYGSFPSLADLPILAEDAGAKAIQNEDGMDNSPSSDEYGSFPASPDLRALI